MLETSESDKRFVGAVIGSLTQSMVVLAGAEIVYKDESAVVQEITDEISKVHEAAGGVAPSANVSGAAAEKLIELGRSTIAGK